MATSTLEKNTLVLKNYIGQENGKDKYKNKSYSNMKLNASAEAMHATGEALGALSDTTVSDIYQNTTSLLQGI